MWKAGVAPAATGAQTALTTAGQASAAAAVSSHRPIEQIRVGQRVVTDGGIANSPGGYARAADPDATRVDPSTWRLLEINVGDWHVQTLQPLSWIAEKHLAPGRAIPLEQIIDVAEMGAPAGLLGTVDEITPCPPVQSGPGRVVLTTVSHLNDDVYDLTLKDASGVSERLGVTGSHRFYDVYSGWTHVNDLHEGERLRGNGGELTVVNAMREATAERVYNMTVEADHVYYVGQLPTLTHNACHGNSDQSQKTASLYQLFQAGENGEQQFLKWGISQDPEKRYTKAFMNGKTIKTVAEGSRQFIRELERIMVEMAPGPLNNEPWAR